MSLLGKDQNGNITKLAGHLTQRVNARWFPCARKVEDGVEYYDLPVDVEEYYKPFSSYLIYSLGFMEPNTTKTPKLRYGDKVLDIYDFTNEDGLVNVGQLLGVYEMFTKNVLSDTRMYFCGSSHRDLELKVAEAMYADSADNATNATNATKATNDGTDKNIADQFTRLNTLFETINTLVDRSLYNLGLYDTCTSNGDGTKTLIIKTYYRQITINDLPSGGAEWWWTPVPGMRGVEVKIAPPDKTKWKVNFRQVPEGWGQTQACFSSGNVNNNIRIYAPESYATPADFLRANEGLYIQYELPSNLWRYYQVLENHPIHMNDLREEFYHHINYKDQLNLINVSDREGNYWVSNQSDITNIINNLEPGVYTLSCDMTPLSINSGYSVDECFTLLQVTGGQYQESQIFIQNAYSKLNETVRVILTFMKLASYSNYECRIWGFGNHNGGNHGKLRVSNFMLNKGQYAYPFEPYNQ